MNYCKVNLDGRFCNISSNPLDKLNRGKMLAWIKQKQEYMVKFMRFRDGENESSDEDTDSSSDED